MDLTPTLPSAVHAVWIGALILVTLLVPVVVLLLHRVWRAAAMIARYLMEMAGAAEMIAANTSAASALQATRAAAQTLLTDAAELQRDANLVAVTLSQRASEERHP